MLRDGDWSLLSKNINCSKDFLRFTRYSILSIDNSESLSIWKFMVCIYRRTWRQRLHSTQETMCRRLSGFIRFESSSSSDSQKTKRSHHHKSWQHRLRQHGLCKYFQNVAIIKGDQVRDSKIYENIDNPNKILLLSRNSITSDQNLFYFIYL